MDADVAFEPALKLAGRLRRRELTSIELVESCLRRIEAIDGVLRSFITVAADSALDAARRADARLAAGDRAPFLGVPISVKDLQAVAGVPTTMGSRAFAPTVPAYDDEVVARLRRAGFVILGKTNTPEFGTSIVTESHFGACRNPWDLTRASGGSSGGAAASVAAGLCPVAHGTDAGGSIRIPAGACGVVGLKPARGRVSMAPAPQSMQMVHGPMARTVADAAAVLDAIAGYAVGDAYWAPPPERSFLAEVGRPAPSLRIAVSCGGHTIDPDHRATLERAAGVLESLGHRVEPDDPGEDWARPPGESTLRLHSARLGVLERLADDPTLLTPFVRMMLEHGRDVPAREAFAAAGRMDARCRRIVGFFDEYDVLLTPTLAGPPPLVGALDGASLERMLEVVTSLAPFTSTWNETGQPAISLPVGVDRAGRPVGVQLVGRPAAEGTLLRVAAQLEAALPWAGRRPALPEPLITEVLGTQPSAVRVPALTPGAAPAALVQEPAGG